jgi:CBS domain-containing protein
LLREADSIQHASTLFRELHISGAPVVNDAGEPVGLLSLSDIMRAVLGGRSRAAGSQPAPADNEWQALGALLGEDQGCRDSAAAEQVGSWMSRRLVSVRTTTPLVDVARVMCNGHWHRVTVVDEQGRLKGIVSTMDVLAALVQTADEAAQAEPA